MATYSGESVSTTTAEGSSTLGMAGGYTFSGPSITGSFGGDGSHTIPVEIGPISRGGSFLSISMGISEGVMIPLGSLGHINRSVRAVNAENGQLIENSAYIVQPSSVGRLGLLDGGLGSLAFPPVESDHFQVVTTDGMVWKTTTALGVDPLNDPDPYTIPFEPVGSIGGASGLHVGGVFG